MYLNGFTIGCKVNVTRSNASIIKKKLGKKSGVHCKCVETKEIKKVRVKIIYIYIVSA